MNCGIFSLHDSSKNGGLEAYIRTLEIGLQQRGIQVNGADNTSAVAGRLAAIWRPRVKRLLPLMSRRNWRWMARWYAEKLGSRNFNPLVTTCDVVHFVGTGWDLAGFALARSARKFNRVITCLPAVHPGTWGDSPLDIDFYKMADAVLVLSKYEADHLAALGVPSDKLTLSGCASTTKAKGDGNRFRRMRNLEGKTIVLFIGRKSVGKGYHALRSAMSHLTTDRRNLVLISIGGDFDPPYPSLDPAIDIDLGAVDDATKQDALAACDIFALPSEAESFGIVYTEAWANSKPVICGTAPASRELVCNHKAGLVTDGSSFGIARAISQLLDNPEPAAEMGRAGKHAVAHEYTVEKIVDRHLTVWEELLTHNKRMN